MEGVRRSLVTLFASAAATYLAGGAMAAVILVAGDSPALGDLYAFLYWLAPFSLALAVSGVLFAVLSRGRGAAWRILPAPAARPDPPPPAPERGPTY